MSDEQAKGQEEIQKILSPLAGVDSRSLDAIMSEDVELLKDQDVDRIVAEIRRVRAGWEAAEAQGKVPRARAAKGPSTKGTVSKLDLGDIGL